MLKRALASSPSPKVELIYAAPDREHILYAAEFDALARTAPGLSLRDRDRAGRENLPIACSIGASAMGHRRRDRTRHFYICGVGKGVIRLRDLLRGAGYERRSVHYEQW